MKNLVQLFTEYYLPKRNFYRGDFFWAKQAEDKTPDLETTNRNQKRLIEIEEKGVHFQHNLSRRTTDIKIYDSNHQEEITGQDNEKTLK